MQDAILSNVATAVGCFELVKVHTWGENLLVVIGTPLKRNYRCFKYLNAPAVVDNEVKIVPILARIHQKRIVDSVVIWRNKVGHGECLSGKIDIKAFGECIAGSTNAVVPDNTDVIDAALRNL